MIELTTRSTAYRFEPTPSGSGLRALSWGPADESPPVPSLPTVPSFDTEEDRYPHEFSVDGTRHAMESELLVHRADGTNGALVRLAAAPRLQRDGDEQHCHARLEDVAGALAVDLRWSTSRHHDVVTRSATLTNTGPDALVLPRALTGAFNIHLPRGAVVEALSGAWCEEFTDQHIVLPRGSWRIGSRQGLVSHSWSPVVSLSDPESPQRGCWSVAVAWSGSWQLDVHATSRGGWVRVAGGLDEESCLTLLPGESVRLPDLLGLWAPSSDEAARRWHQYQRSALLRPFPHGRRPVLYNSWYATEFDVTLKGQLALADRAAQLGCELFVVDDGWFQGRDSDHAGLGDWEPDPGRFPDGLAPLVEQVHRLGMRFGLWVEPESVNADSNLFRNHPDWIYRSPHREPVTMRHQYVLDIGRPEVEAWALATLRRILTKHRVDYLKWDMNRAITDAARPRDPHGRQWAQQHAGALHRIMDALRLEFPEVAIEACAGGGARVSNAVLPRADVVWPSDETGPRDRLAIQHGFLSAYPAATMSSWVTDSPGSRDDRPASLTYRFCVAMCGVLGIGADIMAWDEQQLDTARQLVSLYKRIRGCVADGEVHRHGDPRAHGYAVEFAMPERDGQVVLLVFAAPGCGEEVRLSLRAVEQARDRVPQVTGGTARWEDSELVVDIGVTTGACVIVLAHDG